MLHKYTPPQKKIITSVSLDEDVRNWINKNIPNRSDFFNALARDYMLREEELKKRGKVKSAKA